MSGILVAYFSATGTTARAAASIADTLGAALYEIAPVTPYTKADLNWMNPFSRSTREMKGKDNRPPLGSAEIDLAPYDTIVLGFPIWWYVAPTLVNSFLEKYDLSGKKLILFATSGGSDFGKTALKMAPSCPGAEIVEGRVFKRKDSPEAPGQWAAALRL